jgi:hypothetical protein
MLIVKSRVAFGRLLFAACCLPPAAWCSAAEPPAFVVEGASSDTPAGPLIRMTADGTVTVGGAAPIPGDQVVAIRREGKTSPTYPHGQPQVLLANGDRLAGRLLSIADEKARLLADLGSPQELSIPLSALAAVMLDGASVSRPAENRRDDAVTLTNGDTATGTIVAWPAGGPLRLDAEGRIVELPRERVHALFFSPQLARGAKPRSAYRRLVLTNGSRLSVRSVESAGAELHATLPTGTTVHIPLTDLAAINVYNGPAIYLSDLAPLKYEHVPYLGGAWPWAADHSVAGGDLRLGGGAYDKGIGMHSRSRLTFPVTRGATRFECVVGLDNVSGRRGNVDIQVLADGKLLLSQPTELAGTDAPKSLRLPLPPGARELTLVVDYGRGGDVQDHVDWADARIIVANAALK